MIDNSYTMHSANHRTANFYNVTQGEDRFEEQVKCVFCEDWVRLDEANQNAAVDGYFCDCDKCKDSANYLLKVMEAENE